MRSNSEASAGGGMSEWQPIETAPLDGKRFLGYVPIQNHRLLICMRSKQGLILNESLQPHFWPVTHWMPLPLPPQPAANPEIQP